MDDEKLTKAEETQRIEAREDLETPHQCTAEPLDYEGGVSLEMIEGHTNELNQLVEQMMEDMTRETRILEGTYVVTDYALLRDALDREENELNHAEESKQ
jgi:hypothetical protein